MVVRRFICCAIIFSSLFGYAQNINYLFPNFDKTGMESDVLYNPAGISNINNYPNQTHDLYSFYQAYKAIAFSDFQQRLPNLQNIKQMATSELMSLDISLALLFTEYDTFNEQAKNNELITKTNDNSFERVESEADIFNHHRLLIAAALKPIQRGSQVTYNLSAETFFNTTNKDITKIEIDFGDNQGYRLAEINSPINISYEDEGDKVLKFKITLDNLEVVESAASLNVIYSNQELNEKNNQEIIGFTSGTTDPPYIQPYNEYPFKGWGEMDIFYSADNVLDKPIFLIDGFDPVDSRNVNGLYEALNFSGGNLGDIVRANGYDVVVLNFPTYFREEDQVWIYGGADYIERNAMLLVELIKYINNLKVGEKKNVVIGPSMGGLVARYALNYMESIGVDHESRLYISFDAPHAGANVPIGFQHMFNYLAYGLDTWAGDFSVEALRPVIDRMLRSPAARQMLWDQYESHLVNGGPEFNNDSALPQPHPFFNTFYNAIDTVYSFEYPQNTRNVTIINGSSSVAPYYDNNGMAVTPGAQVLDAYMPNVSDDTNADLDVWYTPYINQIIPISQIYIDAPWWCFCDITTEALAQSHGHTDGIDAAPGGLFDISVLASAYTGSDAVVADFISQLQTNHFTFVPSISAMDYFTNNWYEYMNNPDNSPFEAWSMSSGNEMHTELTPANVEFTLNEIFNGEQVGIISEDADKKSAVVFVEDGGGNVYNGKMYASSVRGASRSGNGNSNDAFGDPGDWSVDLTVSEKTPQQAAEQHGGFTEAGHPLYNQGDGNWSLLHNGMGAVAWGSFTANAYNRASGLGAVALGFNTIAGPQSVEMNVIDGSSVGQFSAGWASRAIGNISTATGFRNTASGQASVAMGSYNYATGDSSIAMGKENWAQGASTIAMGERAHAAGGGSVAMGKESIAWGTTNFTTGYQTIAGDTSAGEGTGGSATAMGHGTFAQGRSSFAANKYTSATNQGATSLGLGTTADNFGMLAIGVNNTAGIGDTTADPNNYGGYYYADGEYTGSNPGVAFVIGNGDINSGSGNAGSNSSNAFIVNFDGSATLAGELTVNSDARLKANVKSLGNTLPKLLLLDGKKYTLKNNSHTKIGLLAQDVQKLFPELVKKGEDKKQTLSLFYQGLVPVLINAIKAQQQQLEELKKKLINKLEN
jgi:hypothetical protein